MKPQETRVVSVQIQAAKTMDKQPLVLTGALNDGLKVLPLVFSVQTTPPIDVRGYTRAIEIANHSERPDRGQRGGDKARVRFPAGRGQGDARSLCSRDVMPLQITPNASYHGNFNSLNVPVYYTHDA